MRRWIRAWLFVSPLRALELNVDEKDHLILFNDRNRIARLFRLVFADYAVIEDGLSNYSGKRLKIFERLWRFLTGNRIGRRYLGDDSRCRAVYLLNPDNAPSPIKEKVQPIDFISKAKIKSLCFHFFRYDAKGVKNNTYSCILATQPIAVAKFTASCFDLEVYAKMLEHLSSKGLKPIIKVHPREEVERYRNAFPGYEVVESKVPLELMIFGAEGKCEIVSIYSTAGMGFEQYCRRTTLIRDDEAENMANVFESWRKDASSLDSRIADLL